VWLFLEDIPALPTSRKFTKKKCKTGGRNIKIQKIIAFDKHLPELFFVVHFHSHESLFFTLKNYLIADLNLFDDVFKVLKNNETVDCRQTCLNCF